MVDFVSVSVRDTNLCTLLDKDFETIQNNETYVKCKDNYKSVFESLNKNCKDKTSCSIEISENAMSVPDECVYNVKSPRDDDGKYLHVYALCESKRNGIFE